MSLKKSINFFLSCANNFFVIKFLENNSVFFCKKHNLDNSTILICSAVFFYMLNI